MDIFGTNCDCKACLVHYDRKAKSKTRGWPVVPLDSILQAVGLKSLYPMFAAKHICTGKFFNLEKEDLIELGVEDKSPTLYRLLSRIEKAY